MVRYATKILLRYLHHCINTVTALPKAGWLASFSEYGDCVGSRCDVVNESKAHMAYISYTTFIKGDSEVEYYLGGSKLHPLPHQAPIYTP